MLISIDTLRADALGCYGSESAVTPHLDALAADGVRFASVVSPAPITLPAHSTMLTGTNPPYHGVHDNADYRLSESNVTLAEIARDAGYDTGAVVASFMLARSFGLSQGFDSYDDDFGGGIGGSGIPERPAEEVADAAIAWLDQRGERPFLLFVHFYDPHDDYAPPAAYRRGNDPHSLYAGEVTYTDAAVGRIVEHLRSLGLYDETLILVTSDHGEMLGEHGEETHTYFIYEGSMRVPWIVKPRNARELGRVVEAPVGLVDVVPTVCGLLEIDPPPVTHGIDASRLWLDADDAQARFLYSESMTPTKTDASPLLALVDERWKYIHTARPELYDVVADPSERQDRATSDPDRARAMRNALGQLLEAQVREVSDAQAALADEAESKLRSLGYTSGNVVARFDLEAMQGGNDPKDMLGFAQRDMAINLMRVQGRIEEALKLGNELLAERPNSINTRLQVAKLALDSGDLPTAIEHAQHVLGVDPDQLRAHITLATAYERLGQRERAEEHFRRVQAFFQGPGAPAAPGGSAGSGPAPERVLDELIAARKFAEARTLGEQLLSRGESLAILRRMTRVALATQDAAAAIDFARRTLLLEPEDVDAHYALAFASEKSGQTEQARASFERVLELDPDRIDAHFRLGVLSYSSDPAAATEHFRAALAGDPDLLGARMNLGGVLLASGDAEAALAEFDEVLRRHPDTARAHLQRGHSLEALGRAEDARAAFARARELDPSL